MQNLPVSSASAKEPSLENDAYVPINCVTTHLARRGHDWQWLNSCYRSSSICSAHLLINESQNERRASWWVAFHFPMLTTFQRTTLSKQIQCWRFTDSREAGQEGSLTRSNKHYMAPHLIFLWVQNCYRISLSSKLLWQTLGYGKNKRLALVHSNNSLQTVGHGKNKLWGTAWVAFSFVRGPHNNCSQALISVPREEILIPNHSKQWHDEQNLSNLRVGINSQITQNKSQRQHQLRGDCNADPRSLFSSISTQLENSWNDKNKLSSCLHCLQQMHCE